MSTDMKMQLKTADKQLDELERKLPLFQRLRRRYLTGRMFVVSQLFEFKGRVEGVLFASLIVGKTFWTGVAAKFPFATGVAVMAWDHAVEFVEGVLLLFTAAE